MMFVLALLDLPLRSAEHETSFENSKMTLTAGSDMVVFHQEIKPAVPLQEKTPVLVSQNFFRNDDRYRFVNNERIDKFVTDEFLVQTVYGCQVVVTNPTSTPQKLDLLLQIPRGSMPLLNGQATRAPFTSICNHSIRRPSNTCSTSPSPASLNTIRYRLPRKSNLWHSPNRCCSTWSIDLTNIDRESWAYVSQAGTDEDVLKYLDEYNLLRIDLDKIAFRMQDKDFFLKVVQRACPRPCLQQHAVVLRRQTQRGGSCPPVSDSERRLRATVWDLPVQSAAGHRSGSAQNVPAPGLSPAGQRTCPSTGRAAQDPEPDGNYSNTSRLLTILSYQRALDDDQLMAVTYYLLLQDRVEEALELFSRVRPDRLVTRLQYDYFTAYLDFYTDEPKLAGPIVQRYVDYPVDRWRKAFAVIANQLQEIEGAAAAVVDQESREQTQTALAATEPGFEFTVESRTVQLNYQNLSKVRVNFYLMDIELLFSRNPFVQQYSDQFSFIRPNETVELELPADKTNATLALPEQLQNSNVLVEIQGGGLTKTAAYYSNALSVQLIENYGQVQVKHQSTGKPLAKVYVKVYARMEDGRVRFYKDGYTDLRGRFDYTSLNTNDLDFAQKFSLLILSDQHGAVVREADPPKR